MTPWARLREPNDPCPEPKDRVTIRQRSFFSALRWDLAGTQGYANEREPLKKGPTGQRSEKGEDGTFSFSMPTKAVSQDENGDATGASRESPFDRG